MRFLPFLLAIFLAVIPATANNAFIASYGQVTAFTLTSPTTSLYQRDPSATSTAVPFSGTRLTPNATQGRVLLVADNSVIVDWTTAAVAGGFTYSGSVTVPQGGPYYRQVRDSTIPTNVVTDSTPFSVGEIVGMYGQSNADYFMGQQTAPVPIANANTYVWVDNSGWVSPSSAAAVTASASGNGARELLNDIQTYLGGIPVGLVFGGQAATSLNGLKQGTVPYNIYAARITASGGKLAAQFWSQGEDDAAAHTPEADYLNALDAQLYTPLATLVGRSRSQFPFLLSSLASYGGTGNSTESGWGAQQTTLEHAGSLLTGAIYSHSNIDAPRLPGDNFHWNGIGQQNSAARFAETYSNFLSISAHKSGWFPTAAARTDATHTRVTVVQSAGTDFTPTSAISGFSLSNTAWASSATPTGAVRFDATHIDLTHANLGTSTKLLRYQYGPHPDLTADVVDNSTLSVPLNQTADDLIVVGSSPSPAPVFITLSGTVTNPTSSQAKFSALGVGAPAITTPSGQRFLIVMITRQSGGTTLNSVLIQKAGQSDITLTSGSGLTTIGNVTAGQAYVAYVALPDAYGYSADFTLSFSAAIFSTPMVSVFVVDKSTLSGLTPAATAFNTAASTTAVSSGNFATSAGGFTLAATQNSTTTGLPITITDDASVELYNPFSLLSPVAGATPTIGLGVNAAAGATNSLTATFSTSANLTLGVSHWR